MKRVGLCIFVLFLLILPAQAQGRAPAQPQLIRLQTATFDPLADGEPSAAIGPQALETAGPYYIVQFKGPIEQVWVRQLEHLGAELLGYIPDHAHVARIQPADVEKVRQMYAVRWLGPYRPGYKLAPALASQARLANAQAIVDVYVAGFPGESLATLRSLLTGLGATIEDAAESEIGITLRVQVAFSALAQIAHHPAISWVEPYAPLKIDNAEGRKIMGVEQVWQNSGLFGTGQIVAVSDSGLSVQGTLSPDFGPAGRLKRAFAPSEMNLSSNQCRQKTTWTDLNGHGSHVAGSVLGNGSASGSSPANRQFAGSQAGPAPEAQLVFMALNTDGSLGIQCVSTNGDFIAKGYQEGARISSNSWGSSPNGAYSMLSSIVDNYIWNHKDYTVLYSAGNAGADGSQTIGSPGTAKNVITVGASENNRPGLGPISDNPAAVANFSSRGPTADGRVKPDIVAPGTRIISVLGAQASGLQPIAPGVPYAFSDGTSMATPLAAGATTLAREWLGKLRGMPNPSAAFLKALIIHGASRLPGAAIPDTNSGWGRVDLKNTLSAQYAVFDDHLQGLSNRQVAQYTIQVAGSNNAGTLLVAGPDRPSATDTIRVAATRPLTPTTVAPRPAGWRIVPAPGFDRATNRAPLRPTPGQHKADLAPVTGRAVPARRPAPAVAATGPVINSTLVNMIAGGHFENPNLWDVWLGYGVPTITNGSDGGLVLNGQYSLWLGGSPTDDSVWYPLSFPQTIDTSQASRLDFKLQMTNLDGELDSFCFAFIDESGDFISDFGGCFNQSHLPPASALSFPISGAQKASLAGKTGYLVLYNLSDHLAPHMSAFVDDIVLTIDFDDVTLDSVPSSGPAGTTFLLTGSNYVPYTLVDICIPSCGNPNNVIGGAYSDARGDLLAYLYTTTDTTPASYTVATSDVAARSATTTVDVTGLSQPALSVSPTAGPAGTTFSVTGTDFVPNDSEIEVRINGQSQGDFGSDAGGDLTFTVRTWSNTPPGTYTVQATDSADGSASVDLVVTAVPGGSPTLTVAPAAGPPGSSFTFSGSGFAPSATVDFSLDGQALGRATADNAGGFRVTLNTNPNIPPATYTLAATQGDKRASAQFEITGGGGGPTPSGNGIYVTLAWTDPPAQANAAATLINNLDLRVVGSDGTTYLGNGGTTPDVKNNVEGIRIERPAPGTYTIYVEAKSVDAAFGGQPFALIATTAQSFGANGTNAGLGRKIYLPLGRR
jgi:Subtilase family